MRLSWTAVAVVVLTACSSDPAPTAAPAMACAPGRTLECPCPGSTGAQTCDDDGSGYGACVCPVAPAGGTGGAGGKVSAGKAGETASGGAGAAGMAVAAGGAGHGGAAAGMAGAGGETAGHGGETSGQAGAGGEAGAGGGGAAGAPCVVPTPPGDVCPCPKTPRSDHGEGFLACPKANGEPVCDCSFAPEPFSGQGVKRCDHVGAKDEAFRDACKGDATYPECWARDPPGQMLHWPYSFCAEPLGGPVLVEQIAGGYAAIVCCRPQK